MTKYPESPSVAAISTGYSDEYQFSRMPVTHTGFSPRTYVRLIQCPEMTAAIRFQYGARMAALFIHL